MTRPAVPICLHRLATRLRRSEGQSLIETAVTLPVFFLLIFGFIDLSLITMGMGNANFASRAALRYATMHSDTSYSPTTQQALNNIVAPYIFVYPSNTYSVRPFYTLTNTVGSGVNVVVTVTYTFSMFGNTYPGFTYISTANGLIVQ